MPRGRPTKDISRKDFEGLLSIGADQEEITDCVVEMHLRLQNKNF